MTGVMRNTSPTVIAMAIVILPGCSPAPAEPEFWVPPGAVPFHPPQLYSLWQEHIAMGVAAHHAGSAPSAAIASSWPEIEWFAVPGGPWHDHGTDHTVGLRTPDNEVYIASGYLEHEGVIKHELLHVYLAWTTGDGDPGHLHPLFSLYHPTCFRRCDAHSRQNSAAR